jgi:hypothetical protein
MIITLMSFIMVGPVSCQVPYVKPEGAHDLVSRGAAMREGYLATIVDAYHIGRSMVDAQHEDVMD